MMIRMSGKEMQEEQTAAYDRILEEMDSKKGFKSLANEYFD
jgi:hypothetical protein